MKNKDLCCEEHEVHYDKVTHAKEGMFPSERFEELSVLFKMFADATRLKILHLLFQDELCVCDISEALEMSQSAISHQLSILRANRIIKTRRSGKNIFYSLDDAHIQMIFDAGLVHIMEK